MKNDGKNHASLELDLISIDPKIGLRDQLFLDNYA